MGLGSFAVPPGDANGLSVWAFAHLAHHRDINRRIFETLGTTLTDYVLDPIDLTDMGDWLVQHQIMHDAMNQTLYGAQGYNLQSLEWRDYSNLQEWLAQNYAEHARAATTLGVD